MKTRPHAIRPRAFAIATVTGILSIAAPVLGDNFAYFLDNFTDSNINVAVPAGTVLIGWTTQTQRNTIVAAGRVVGASAGLSSAGSSKARWRDTGSPPDLHTLFNTATPPDLSTPALRKIFAAKVLLAAQVDPGSFPSATDPAKPTATSGYVMWTQDIEGPLAVPEETAAAIAAIMWAGREILGPDMQIIPVPASVIQKTAATTWNLKSVFDGNSSDNFLKFLNLKGTLSSANQLKLDSDSIDLLSALHLVSAESHPLIDGILAQQYSASGCVTPDECPTNCASINCTAIPGSLSSDTPAFFDTTLPYAIMSAHDCPSQLFLAPPSGGCPGVADAAAPWKSYYRGSLPFHAGVYWNQTTIDPQSTFNPTNYLIPTPAANGGFSSGTPCVTDLNGDHATTAQDLAMLLGFWGAVAPFTPGDFNSDSFVDAQDLAALLLAWGPCPLEQPSGWISVLIAQEVPPTAPADLQIYVAKILKLAPALEQIHLRFAAGATNYQTYADLITLLRAAYGSTLAIGFHPDNSNSSCSPWGCSQGADNCPPDPSGCGPTDNATWQCILNKSIIAMNTINAIADPTMSGRGFTIFSLEQSSMENVSTGTPSCPTDWLSAIKATLSATTGAISGVTLASPAVKFGNVGPSYGGPEIYGTTKLDFGYTQMYNLGKHLTAQFSSLVTSAKPYFPAYSAASCLPPTGAFPCMVVDVDSNCAYQPPKIPCFGPKNCPNVYMYTDPVSGSGPSPTLASAYVAFLMTQYPPISNTVPLSGSTVYMMFSGEPEFLGSSGWTLDKINAFNQQLNPNFTALKQRAPGLFPAGGTDPATLKYGIWNYASILDAISLP